MNVESNFQLFRRALRNGKLVAAEGVALTFSVAKLAAASGIAAGVIVIGAIAAVDLDGVHDKIELFRLVWKAAFMLSLLLLAAIHRSPIAAWMKYQRGISGNERNANG